MQKEYSKLTIKVIFYDYPSKAQIEQIKQKLQNVFGAVFFSPVKQNSEGGGIHIFADAIMEASED